MNYDVTALGELLIDLTQNGMSEQGNPILEANPGGAPCNVLACLSKMGHKAAFIGKVGKAANAAPVRQPEPLLLVIESEGENAPEPVLQLQTDGGVIGIDMDEYLSCVVLSELPSSFALETMKAQTVAARTYTCRAITHGKHTDADLCDDPACCQAFHTKDKLRERLGEAFDAAWEKATTAVSETEDTILCSGGEPIEAVYYYGFFPTVLISNQRFVHLCTGIEQGLLESQRSLFLLRLGYFVLSCDTALGKKWLGQ